MFVVFRFTVFFLLLASLASYVSAESYVVEGAVESHFKSDSYCPDGPLVVNTDYLKWYVRAGSDCGGDVGFTELVCKNDQTVTIAPGAVKEASCEVDVSPFAESGLNCVRVKWCGDVGDKKYDATPLGVLSSDKDKTTAVTILPRRTGSEPEPATNPSPDDANVAPKAQVEVFCNGKIHNDETDLNWDNTCTINSGETAELSGYMSVDPDGKIAKYSWSVSGLNSVFDTGILWFYTTDKDAGSFSDTPGTATMIGPGTYVATLTVTDDKGKSAAGDPVKIIVNPPESSQPAVRIRLDCFRGLSSDEKTCTIYMVSSKRPQDAMVLPDGETKFKEHHWSISGLGSATTTTENADILKFYTNDENIKNRKTVEKGGILYASFKSGDVSESVAAYVKVNTGVYEVKLTVTDDNVAKISSEPVTIIVVGPGYECPDPMGLTFFTESICDDVLYLMPIAKLSISSEDTPTTHGEMKTAYKKIGFDPSGSNFIGTSVVLDYGDGTSDEIKSGDKPFHVYPDYMTFYPVLTVTDKAGRMGEDHAKILITAQACSGIPGAACKGESDVYECKDTNRKTGVSDCPETCCVLTCKQYREPEAVVRMGRCSGDLTEGQQDIYAGEEICLEASGSKGCGLSFDWQIFKGSGAEVYASSKGVSMKQVFTGSGDYTVRLNISDSQGASSEKTIRLNVKPMQASHRLFDAWAASNPSEKGKDAVNAFAGEDVYFSPVLFDAAKAGILRSFSIHVSGPTNLQPGGTTLDSDSSQFKDVKSVTRVFGLPGDYAATLKGESADGVVVSQNINIAVTCKNICTGDTECLPENRFFPDSDAGGCCRVCTLKKELAEKELKELDLPSECKSVIYQGDHADKLDIVFIPSEGYTPEEFDRKVKEAYTYLFTYSPFDKHATKINIWKVFKPAKCSLNDGLRIDCLPTDAEGKCPSDKRVFLVKLNGQSHSELSNTKEYVSDSTSMDFWVIFVHELGHLLDLNDEYLGYNGVWQDWARTMPKKSDKRNSGDLRDSVNCDISALCQKWTDPGKETYVADAACFPGCSYPNGYRSANHCIMDAIGRSFCPVCNDYLDDYLRKHYK